VKLELDRDERRAVGRERAALNLPLPPQALAQPREGLFANHLTLYISVVLIVALASYGYWLKNRSIFACQAYGYSADQYLAYCGGGNYADYEHGAFLFDLEPPSLQFARDADVLVIGNSRLQIALSTQPTADFFAAAKARYYLMGFSYNENAAYTGELLRKMRPRASVFIINVNDFFRPGETVAAKAILHDPDAKSKYEWKGFVQKLHRPICERFGALCGRKYAVFRSRENGGYYRIPRDEPVLHENAVSYDPNVDPALVKDEIARAVDFLKQFAKGRCVILTNAPYPGTNEGESEAIAKGVGLPLVTLENLEGLNTSDGYHLDRVSADGWSRAFFEAVGPEIRSCIERHGVAS
jgi:hypothetical protein